MSTIGPNTKNATTGAVPNRLSKDEPMKASASEQRDIVKASISIMTIAKIFVDPRVNITRVGK